MRKAHLSKELTGIEMKVVAVNSTGKNVALIVSMMSSFLAPFMFASVNIALPAIGAEFALDAVVLSWVASSYLLASAVFLVPFGRMADIYGRKKLLAMGTAIYTAASLLAALAPSAAVLLIFRVIQGIGSAMVFGTAVAILTSVFPAKERGKVLGINVTATYLGLSLGPTLGGLLTQNFGWRSIFAVNVPLGIAILLVMLWKLKGEWADARGEKLDYIGSVIYGIALIAVMYGLSILPDVNGLWLIAIGIIGVIIFIRWEIRAKSPVLRIDLFRDNAAFSFSNLAALISYSATAAVGLLLSLYLQLVKGFTPTHAGLILVCQPLVQAALSPVAGRLSDKIQPRFIASVGMALTTVGLALLVFLNRDTEMVFIVVVLVLFGIGFALFSSPNTNAIMSSVEKQFYGVASGTAATMRLIGQMLSVGIAMLLFSLYIGRVQITPEYYDLFLQSARTGFIIFAAFCLCGVFASLARGKTR